MALSYWLGSGDGTTKTYSVPFPYLSKDHVFVKVDGAAVTAFTWATSTTITFAVAPAVGVNNLKIYRKTSPGTPLVTFTAGYLASDDLNTADLQNFYLAQEATDTANDAVNFSNTIVAQSGNVPAPGNDGIGKWLKATAADAFGWVSILASDISDATAYGISLLRASDAAAARTTLGIPKGLNSQVFTGSGTFTTPADTLSTTQFKFTATGCGAGGGGAAATGGSGSGGGSGATAIYYVSNLTASLACTVTIGGAGAGGAAGANNGSVGGNTSVVVGSTTIIASGGTAGLASGSAGAPQGGVGGTATNGTINITGGDGAAGIAFASSPLPSGGHGGGSFWGGGGRGAPSGNAGTAGKAYGAGGGGGGPGTATNAAGGDGKTGIVTVEWVL